MKLKDRIKEFYKKIVGEDASPEFIARGWAIGMFYGCLIPFGLQLILSIPTAFILKGSKVGATIGTFITNHFTVFVIYPLQCYVGSIILRNGLSYDIIKDAMLKVINEQTYDSLVSCGADLVYSFFMGGFLLTAIMTPITYIGVLYMVKSYRSKKEQQ
ncbi:MAG: DUF2062 domain-containing protein [Verrucomicrobiaceae bacterium]|nr:DUF2062 domain-containing protein [Verrucomicrobiaceae bacterium]